MKKCYISIIATAFLFGTLEVSIKYSGAAFNSIQLTFIRFLIGGILLLPFAISDLKKGITDLRLATWVICFFSV